MVLEKILLGISLAAPIGPVTIEIVRRCLTAGLLAGLMLVVGAVIGDTIFMLMAYYGISTFVTDGLKLGILALIGSLFLLHLGNQNLKNSKIKIDVADKDVKHTLFQSVAMGIALAVINPVSLLFWVSLFATTMVGVDTITLGANMMIIVGVVIWSIFLCVFLSITRKALNDFAISIITKGSSLLLIYFGFKYYHGALVEILKYV